LFKEVLAILYVYAGFADRILCLTGVVMESGNMPTGLIEKAELLQETEARDGD
jgi:hypothetical protein